MAETKSIIYYIVNVAIGATPHKKNIASDLTLAIPPFSASLSQVPSFFLLIVVVLLRPPESQTFELARLALCASICACICTCIALGSVHRST